MFVFLLATALAETWPPGAVIDDAATVDITPQGFEAIASVIPALLPAGIDIPDTGTTGSLIFCDYGFALSNGSANIQVQSSHIVPQNGYLDITANLLVGINDASNQLALNYEYCFGDDTCNGYIDAFPVTIHTTMNLEVVPDSNGQPTLDATIGAIDVEYGLNGDYIHFDCWIQGLQDFLGYVGIDLYGFIIDQFLAPTLESTIADLGPTLETTIEDAFSAAVIQQELDLNGATLAINLFPSDVDITTGGVRLYMSGSMDAAQASCIAAYDPGGSAKTSGTAPDISTLPANAHVALNLSDDFVNEALYAVWRGGTLCIDTNSMSLPISLDTSLLGSLTGNAFADLFPEAKPVVLVTSPRQPLTADFTGSHDVDVQLNDLGLGFYAELDGRQARLLDIGLNGPVGADLNFDSSTGNLGIALALEASALDYVVNYNEHMPDSNDLILQSFSSSFGNLVGTLIGSLLGDSLSFAIPSFSGLGLQSISVEGDAQWLSAQVAIGLVSYGSADSGCGSCGSGGSGTACNVAGTSIPLSLGWMPMLGVLVALRRRKG